MLPLCSCKLDIFAGFRQRFDFSRLRSTPASSIPDVRYTPSIFSNVRKLCQHGPIVFLLAGAVLLESGCADRPFHKTQNLERGQSVFIDATQRAMINTSLSPNAWRAPGQVVPQRIVCTEPSPDVATATAQSFGAALRGDVPGAGGGAARLDASTAQALLKLAERSVTIQYLRDGLYQACQAYANGAITSTAYAVILGAIDETLATTMMAEAAAGTVRDVNAAVGAWATSSGDMPSGTSGSGTTDVDKATSEAANVTLPQTTTVTVTPNAGVAGEIARMHAAFINDAGFDSLMHACVLALDRPKTSAAFNTELSRICSPLVSPSSLQRFGQATDRRIIALAALELASSQARALEAAARVCAQDAKHENCTALRAALPSGASSAALVHEVLSYAKEDGSTSTRRDVTAARQYMPVKAANRQ